MMRDRVAELAIEKIDRAVDVMRRKCGDLNNSDEKTIRDALEFARALFHESKTPQPAALPWRHYKDVESWDEVGPPKSSVVMFECADCGCRYPWEQRKSETITHVHGHITIARIVLICSVCLITRTQMEASNAADRV